MSREWMIQCAVLYVPVVIAALLLACVRDEGRSPVALLMSITWQAAILPVVDFFCQWQGLWRYSTTPWALLKMPLAIHLGWVIWWGAAIPLLLELLQIQLPRVWAWILVVPFVVLLDIWLMPMMDPFLKLAPDWWIGEAWMVIIALIPSMALHQLVRNSVWPLCRSLMISLSFAILVLGVLPVSTVSPVPQLSLIRSLVFALGLALILLPGVWAVVLFGVVGRGTPLPFDPPRRLVTVGIYRWIANPMQTTIVIAMLWVAWFLYHKGLAIAAISTWVYSMGIARWSENVDLIERFGSAWQEYRKNTPAWWPRLRK